MRYNQAFAQALADAAAPEARVMVQDYHLFLVPRMLRDLRPDVRIGLFTHTPVGDARTTSACCPTTSRTPWSTACSAPTCIGFHTERWAELFRATARAVAGVDAAGVAGVPARHRRGRDARAGRPAQRRQRARACSTTSSGDRPLIGRVDRTELSKNVWRGLLAYRELLRTRPEWRGQVVHAVFNNPSREDLPAYREYTARIERLAEEIDDEFGTDDWTPLIFDIGDDYPQALAVLRRSDVVFVNSVRDGMNLVVLEGLVLSEHDPAVVHLPRDRRGRGARRRRVAGQPVRRHRHRRGAAPGADDAARGAGRAGRRGCARPPSGCRPTSGSRPSSTRSADRPSSAGQAGQQRHGGRRVGDA